MNAKQLREAGMLWPQTLSKVELLAELQACDGDKHPISMRMLLAEYHDRQEKGTL